MYVCAAPIHRLGWVVHIGCGVKPKCRFREERDEVLNNVFTATADCTDTQHGQSSPLQTVVTAVYSTIVVTRYGVASPSGVVVVIVICGFAGKTGTDEIVPR